MNIYYIIKKSIEDCVPFCGVLIGLCLCVMLILKTSLCHPERVFCHPERSEGYSVLTNPS